MKLQTMIIGVILGSLFMAMLGLTMGDISNKYGLTYENQTAIYDKINDSYAEALDIQQSLNTTTDTSSNLDILGTMLDKGVAAVRITFNSAGNSIAMVSEASDEIGIPYTAQLAMIAIILVFLLIILIKLFTRSDT